MKNLKVKVKMLILVFSIFITMLIAGVIALVSMQMSASKSLVLLESTIRTDYDTNIKEQVNNAISLIQNIYDDQQAGIYTQEEAQKLAADLVRDLRYKDGGYFWIDTTEGINVVLLGKDTEGTSRIDMKDTNGFELIKEILKAGQQEGGGYTDYMFPNRITSYNVCYTKLLRFGFCTDCICFFHGTYKDSSISIIAAFPCSCIFHDNFNYIILIFFFHDH